MKKLFTLAFILLTATLFYFTRDNKMPDLDNTESGQEQTAISPTSTNSKSKNSQSTSLPVSDTPIEDNSPVITKPERKEIPFDNSKAPVFKPETEKEKSLEIMGAAMISVFKESLSPSQVFDQLKREGLSPQKVEKKNEYIGNQFVINSPVGLKGTRYFKAIYESDENGKYFPLHAFMEFQKGPNSFERAVDFAKSQGNIRSIVSSSDGYLNLKTDVECQHIIVKELKNWEEMKDHPENAYKKSDIGTVQVSIETNPRCD